MARRPVHLVAARTGGRISPRQLAWEAIRRLKTFTLTDLARASRQDRATVKTYVDSLRAGGWLTADGVAAGQSQVFVLNRDSGVEAPRVRRDGSLCLQGRAREQMWRTMRLCNIPFTSRELARLASTDDSPVAEVDALDYVKHLGKAGYLVLVAAGAPGKLARWRFHPAKNTGPNMSAPEKISALARARAAWGETLPDWIEVLAREADRTSQNAAAARIRYSAATVSHVLKAAYKGDITAVEQAVRGVLMAATVNCPVVGDLATDLCLRHQRASWAPHNPQRIQFYRACRDGCPHSRLGERP